MHYAEAATDLLHFDSLTAESVLLSSTDEDLQRIQSWGGQKRSLEPHEAKKPYIQSQTGSVIIDVGGIPHHVKVKNFTQQVRTSRTHQLINLEIPVLVRSLKSCNVELGYYLDGRRFKCGLSAAANP